MLNFKQTRTLPENQMFFLPMMLTSHVLNELRKHQIPYKLYHRRDYNRDDYKQELEIACMNFQKNHWEGDSRAFAFEAIESKAAPEDLFDFCLQLFGPTMDPDFKREQEEHHAKAWQHYLEIQDYIDGIIPIRKE